MTHSPERTAARTEADIRAALMDLAERAPGADAVLSELREAGSRLRQGPARQASARPGVRRPGVRRPGVRLRRPQLAVGAVAAVVATALAVVLTPSSAPAPGLSDPRTAGLMPNPAAGVPGGAPVQGAPGSDSSTASVAKAMLAAFNATAGDLVYETVYDWNKGRYEQNTKTWSWPALPSPGQLEYARDFFSALPVGKEKGSAGVEPVEDDQYVTVVPHPSRYGQKTDAHLIVVCYGGDGQTGCGWSSYETPAGTWSEHTGKLDWEDYTPNPHGAELARQIAHGDWRIVGHTTLRGQQAIKLSGTNREQFGGQPVYLWVSTATYLPLRMYSVEGTGLEIDNWYYLPPTKANLANLRVPIPPGYPRSG
jgi:hypothetical protein